MTEKFPRIFWKLSSVQSQSRFPEPAQAYVLPAPASISAVNPVLQIS